MIIEILIDTKVIYFVIILAAWGTVDLLFKFFKVTYRIIKDVFEVEK